MRLTEHFKLQEFTFSSVLREHLDITPIQLERVHRLCYFLLEPIRRHFNRPVCITGGIRNEKLYQALLWRAKKARDNGHDMPLPSITSDHFAGHKFCPHSTGAADFHVENVPVIDVYHWIRKNDLPFKQLILYPGTFIHLSNRDLKHEPRREVITYYHGKYERHDGA